MKRIIHGLIAVIFISLAVIVATPAPWWRWSGLPLVGSPTLSATRGVIFTLTTRAGLIPAVDITVSCWTHAIPLYITGACAALLLCGAACSQPRLRLYGACGALACDVIITLFYELWAPPVRTILAAMSSTPSRFAVLEPMLRRERDAEVILCFLFVLFTNVAALTVMSVRATLAPVGAISPPARHGAAPSVSHVGGRRRPAPLFTLK